MEVTVVETFRVEMVVTFGSFAARRERPEQLDLSTGFSFALEQLWLGQ